MLMIVYLLDGADLHVNRVVLVLLVIKVLDTITLSKDDLSRVNPSVVHKILHSISMIGNRCITILKKIDN